MNKSSDPLFRSTIDLRRVTLETSIFHRDYLAMKLLITWIGNIGKKYDFGTLLDYGCGNKPYHSCFASNTKQYIGVDVAQNRDNSVDIIIEYESLLPLKDGSFDSVLSTQVLEHIPRPLDYLSEVGRVLRQDGYFILTCPGSYMLHEEPFDYFRFTKYGLAFLLEEAGFDIIQLDTAGGAWRLLGQTFLNHKAFANHLTGISKILFPLWAFITNLCCVLFDNMNLNKKDTLNYMILARKSHNVST